MRNRAKCALCLQIIESKEIHDYVSCACGEIAVDGGKECFRVTAKNWSNFLRIDDQGNIIKPKVLDASKPISEDDVYEPTKKELLDLLADTCRNISDLPPSGLHSYVTHYDLLSVLTVLSAILQSDCKEDS